MVDSNINYQTTVF